MKELYLTMAILCFLAAVTVYCLNKGLRVLRELNDFWKQYKQSQIDFEKTMREFYKEK